MAPIEQEDGERESRLRGPAEILWAVTGLYQGKRDAERYVRDDLSWGDFMGCTTSKEQTDRYVFGFLFSKVFSSGIATNMRIVSDEPWNGEDKEDARLRKVLQTSRVRIDTPALQGKPFDRCDLVLFHLRLFFKPSIARWWGIPASIEVPPAVFVFTQEGRIVHMEERLNVGSMLMKPNPYTPLRKRWCQLCIRLSRS